MVVVALVAGPAISACLDKDADLGACLKARLIDAGITLGLPQITAEPAVPGKATPASAPPIEIADVPPSATTTGPLPVAATVPPTTTIAPQERTENAPALVTLLRVEPDGAVVVAGMAPPGVTIEIWANDRRIGTTTAEKSGDWVFVPDTRLDPGGTELMARVAGSSALPAQSFAIVVDEARQKEALVVVSAPGEASRVLQGLAPPQPAPLAAPPVATATTPAMPVTASSPPAVPETPAVSPEPPAPVAAVPPATARGSLAGPTIDAIEIDGSRDFFAGAGAEGATVRLYVDDAFVADAVVAGGRWLVEAADVLVSRSQNVRVDMLAQGTSEVVARAEVRFVLDLPVEPVEPAKAAPPAPATVAGDVAAATPPPPTPLPRVVGTEPTAMGLEPGLATATGPATPVAPGSAVDVNGGGETAPAPIAASDSPATDLIPSTASLPVAPPAPTTTTSVAARPGPAAMTPPTAVTPPPAAASPPAAVPPAVAPSAAPDALPPSEPELDVAVGQPLPEVAPRTVTTPAMVSVVDVGPPASILPAPELVADGGHAAALPGPGGSPPVLGAPEETPIMLAVPTGDGAEGPRFAAGKVIIRRGDNLWTIARRAYGDGLKYTMIFDANETQIRNPDRIYPGQVFELPGGGE